MFMKIILFVFCYPILPIMYFIIKNELEPHKNIILGVTLPSDELRNPKVKEIISRAKKSMRRIAIVLALLPFTSLLTKYDSIVYAIFITWITVLCFIFFLPFMKGNLQLHKLKKEQNWHLDEEGTTIVDLKVTLEEPNPLSKYWFLPAIVLTCIPIIIDLCTITSKDSNLLSLATTTLVGLVTFLCPFLFHIAYKTKQEIVSQDSLRNQTLTRIRRYNFGKCFIGLSYTNAIYTILFWLYINHYIDSIILFLIITLLYTFFLLWWVLRAEFKVRLAQQQFSIQSEDSFTADEDSYWIYGLLYYNPNDKHLIVPKRVGLGTDMNYAKPAGKVFGVIIALIILAMPISAIGLIQSEFSPLLLTIDEESITAKHFHTTYGIDFDDIKTVETWDELPNISKDNGTGFSTLCKGTYSIAGNGSCTVCFNPTNHLFIVITKENDKKYVFSGSTDKKTEEVYNILITKIP
ncbi:Uncharacterized membrane protein [Anaerosporobacter mobilis DSM 15930]|uniref:Uncharacterized membrane protein n=1 Tax=Anaerosporobacter mobilis DSM 15930 TaxID=1120996 RepID=A0A1M7JTN3_9FIRM|nr:DUF5808 domain-containing protein [Anaerosporobacter mobilis]SHM55907.1 Uncharacterized membrane protein [Anaerosporobacter mobilis DSM 15930]